MITVYRRGEYGSTQAQHGRPIAIFQPNFDLLELRQVFDGFNL